MAGSAATPLALNTAFVGAAEPDDAVLEFDITSSGDNLVVRQLAKPHGRAVTDPQPRPPHVVAQWTVVAAAFGPAAWFELHGNIGPIGERRLVVHSASYGEVDGLELSFVFEPVARPPAKPVKGQPLPEPSAIDWRVHLVTPIWSDPKAARSPWISERKSFSAFAATDGLLAAPAAPVPAADRLRNLFDNRIDADNGAAPLRVAFLNTALWELRRDGAPAVHAFRRRVLASRFTFGWHQDPSLTLIFHGLAESGDVRIEPRFVLGPDAETHLVVTPQTANATQQSRLEARRTQTPLYAPSGRPVYQTYAKASFAACNVAVNIADTTLAEGLAFSALWLTECRLPIKGQPLRHAAWGDLTTDAAGGQEISTRAGVLRVNVAGADASQASADKPASNDSDAVAATGDRSGAPDADLWAVFDKAQDEDHYLARRIAVDLALLAADFALPDASRTTLVFDEPPDAATVTLGGKPAPPGYADMRLEFEDDAPMPELPGGEYPRREASSWIWLGPLDRDAEIASFDLSHAKLYAARDLDLVDLTFRFLDLSLILTETGGAVLRPAHEECRVLQTSPGAFLDDRPVLVVEFPPQHLLEEAIFAQNLLLPDVPGLPNFDRDTVEKTLAGFGSDQTKIQEYRGKVQQQKLGGEGPTDHPFTDFVNAYKIDPRVKSLPPDQQIYIGPFALDPDAMAMARGVLKGLGDSVVAKSVDAMFEGVSDFIKLCRATPSNPLGSVDGVAPDAALRNALRNEALFEQQAPLYGVFRDYYREVMIDTFNGAKEGPCGPDVITACKPVTVDPGDIEFLAEENRPPWTGKTPDDCQGDPRGPRFDAVKALFAKRIAAANPPMLRDLIEARLSGRSRLAFRLNCAPPAGANALEAGLETSSPISPEHPGGGGFPYLPIPFTLAGLTDWSRHEPAVVRRAQKLFEAAGDGLVPPIGARAANLSDVDNLLFQGISRGAVTAEQRLGEIRGGLADKPTPYQTAIEIPARLTLSTAQDAIWFTKRPMPLRVVGQAAADAALPYMPTTKGRAAPPDEVIVEPGRPLRAKGALWTARLDLDGVDPNLRVIDSPDLRPNALTWLGGPRPSPRQPGQGAPPRGPLAPWFIGPEQMDGLTLSPQRANDQLPPSTKIPQPVNGATPPELSDAELCGANWKTQIWYFLRKLCERRDALAAIQPALNFRTVLDAYDRHELVLLSSAHGLPVIGKREAVETANGTEPGAVVKDAGQINPGEDFVVIDADDAQAIQRPQPLHVQELWLSALGGSLLHDTRFQPSAGADNLYGGKIFDGFSIERWREEIVLGRDIVGEVVYKGYLFPLGHRASLVKLTERLFLRGETLGVKATLVQRVFLRVGRKSMSYPAINHPFDGRLWCAKDVSILTLQTPDLQDPTELPKDCGVGINYTTQNPEALNGGRICLRGSPGLAFWPRVNESDSGLIKFAFAIDGAGTEAPLIFVDNIAATNAISLQALCDAYRLVPDWSKRRTLDLNDQKLRYAQERKSGDCSLKTRSLVMTVSGQDSKVGPGWAEGLNVYKTNSILEGAEQPSFYPAVESASVRLEHIERFAGRKAEPVDVQYDGRYARFGFTAPIPGQIKDDLPNQRNPLEIYLNLRACVLLDMGANGDRGGGVGRTRNYVVAIGRANGPVSARTLSYNQTAPTDPKLKAPDSGSTITPDRDDFDLITGDPPYADTFPRLRSLADFFDQSDALANVQAGASGFGGDGVTAATQKIRALLQSFFALEAKLLGVVSFIDLMALLGFDEFASLADAVPVLKETLQFGSGLAEADQNAAEEIHKRLIAPLLNIVESFQSQWLAVGAKIDPTNGENTLNQLFPEISGGLADLKAKLTAALGDNDTLGVALDLSEVYESAQSFVQALERLAANPNARLKAAAVTVIQQVFARLTVPNSPVSTGLADIVKAVASRLADGGSQIRSYIKQQIAAIPAAFDIYAPSLPVPDLAALAAQTGEAFGQDFKDVFGPLAKEGQDFLTKAADLVIQDALSGKSSSDIVKDVTALAITTAQTAVHDAQTALTATLASQYPATAAILNDNLTALQNELISLSAATEDALDASPLLQSIRKAARLAGAIAGALQPLTKTPVDPVVLVAAAANLAGLLFGFDVGTLATQGQTLAATLEKAFGDLKPLFDAVLTIVAHPADAEFRGAVMASAVYQANPSPGGVPVRLAPSGGSVPPQTTPLLVALEASLAAAGNAANWRDALDLPDPNHPNKMARSYIMDAGRPDLIQAYEAAVNVLVSEAAPAAAGPALGLVGRLSDAYCDAVAILGAMSAAAAALSAAPWASLDGKAINLLSSYERVAARAAAQLQADLAGALALTDAALLSSVASTLGELGNNPVYGAFVNGLFVEVQTDFANLEVSLTAGFASILAFAIDVYAATRTAAAKISASADGATTKLLNGAHGFGLRLDPELSLVSRANDNLKSALTAATQLSSDRLKPPPTTFAALLIIPLGSAGAGPLVSDLFGPMPTKTYATISGDLRAAEADLFAAWGALLARVFGLPAAIQDQIVRTAAPALLTLSQAYSLGNGLLGLRNDISASLEDLGVLTLAARRSVFAPPVYGLLPIVNVDDPNADVAMLRQDDRLAEEAKLLADIAGYATLADDGQRATALANFVRFANSWTSSVDVAAPLQIANRIQTVATEVLKGEVLALIDVSSVRDALVDAVSTLVPIKATFSYDFGSSVQDAPDAGSIFQAQQGSRFALSTRIDVDLLAPQNAALTTQGSFGPFAIALVGDYVEALTLRFGGAKFSVEGGGAPQFDISYQSYEIGPALSFAQELQAYLTPSDGAGFHIGPSEFGVGIEVGYGLNLGSISIGPVSFFNIVFDVSADLPFDDRSAVFKTSLGTQTTPFTISALPYAGSGFFSIFAAADGIRGFEAGFLFGGGGSVHFGPLEAQVQVQIGVFLRILKVQTGKDQNGVDTYLNLTEVAGTFLAAGSASIWIFHFGATLFVSLGQDNEGHMQGEATFTFSFTCGFIHYHYSVTAHHDQAPAGHDNTARLEAPHPLTRFALAALPNRMSDTYDDLVEIAALASHRSQTASRKSLNTTTPDVRSDAVCQSEDWGKFTSYFDLQLVGGG